MISVPLTEAEIRARCTLTLVLVDSSGGYRMAPKLLVRRNKDGVTSFADQVYFDDGKYPNTVHSHAWASWWEFEALELVVGET